MLPHPNIKQDNSQMSTVSFISNNPKLITYMEQLNQQNQYLKKALSTAQALIASYQQENQTGKIQIKKIKEKLIHSQSKCNQLAQKIFKLQSKLHKQLRQMKNQNRHKNQDTQELNLKIRQLVQAQEKYQQKIINLENKIVLLERANDYNKVSKQQCILNIGLARDYISTTPAQIISQKKPKNFTDLQALHRKIRSKELQVNKNKEERISIVQRVFSKQTIRNTTPHNFTKRKLETPIKIKK